MTIKDIDELFLTDEEGRFLNLILPKDKLGEEKDYRGKKRLELNIDEIVRIKIYANMLYEQANG